MSKCRFSPMEQPAVKFYYAETKDSQIYEYLARLEKNPKLRRKLKGLADIERQHAKFWKDYLKKRGVVVKERKLGLWKRFGTYLLRKLFGVSIVISLSEMGESSATYAYYDFYTQGDLSLQEKETLSRIILDEMEHEKLFYEEKKFLHVENIRDIVLGMNDGLVEILGAVTGLSAVYVNNPLLVGLSGLIVGVAGSLSMAIGSYVSVRSQRQVNEGLRKRFRIMLSVSEKRARKEIEERLKGMGLPESLAVEAAQKMSVEEGNIEKLLPEEVTNEVRSAIYTGFAYIIGVMFPVMPYFFSPTTYIALPFSVISAGIALSIVSGIISIMSGISVKRKVAEMIILGLGAAGLSYLFGTLMNIIFGATFS